MLVASLWLALVVAIPGPAAWACSAGALALLAALLLSYGNARVSVEGGWLRAGRARIEAVHLGEVAALDAEETRRVAGPEADARAYLLLRPYLKRAVRVEITDPADPAPYWLVSSRHPDDLARRGARSSAESAARLTWVLSGHGIGQLEGCGPSSPWSRGWAPPR